MRLSMYHVLRILVFSLCVRQVAVSLLPDFDLKSKVFGFTRPLLPNVTCHSQQLIRFQVYDGWLLWVYQLWLVVVGILWLIIVGMIHTAHSAKLMTASFSSEHKQVGSAAPPAPFCMLAETHVSKGSHSLRRDHPGSQYNNKCRVSMILSEIPKDFCATLGFLKLDIGHILDGTW